MRNNNNYKTTGRPPPQRNWLVFRDTSKYKASGQFSRWKVTVLTVPKRKSLCTKNIKLNILLYFYYTLCPSLNVKFCYLKITSVYSKVKIKAFNKSNNNRVVWREWPLLALAALYKGWRYLEYIRSWKRSLELSLHVIHLLKISRALLLNDRCVFFTMLPPSTDNNNCSNNNTDKINNTDCR